MDGHGLMGIGFLETEICRALLTGFQAGSSHESDRKGSGTREVGAATRESVRRPNSGKLNEHWQDLKDM